MPMFMGKPQTRSTGSSYERDFTSLARRASTHGGRVLSNREGTAFHLVGPSGRRWGSFDKPAGLARGGDLSPVVGRANDDLFDVTEEYLERDR